MCPFVFVCVCVCGGGGGCACVCLSVCAFLPVRDIETGTYVDRDTGRSSSCPSPKASTQSPRRSSSILPLGHEISTLSKRPSLGNLSPIEIQYLKCLVETLSKIIRDEERFHQVDRGNVQHSKEFLRSVTIFLLIHDL